MLLLRADFYFPASSWHGKRLGHTAAQDDQGTDQGVRVRD